MAGVSFDRAVDYYDLTRGYSEGTAERIRDAIVTRTGATSASRLLEMGVGTGRIALPFIRAGYDYTGVDLSQPMMQRLEEKLAEDGEAALATYRYRLLEGDVTALVFAAGSFDIALTVHVMHLVDNWQQAVDEARRVLRHPNGKLVIGYDEVTQFAASPARHRWFEILEELGVKRANPHKRLYGPDGQITAYLQEQGAQVETVTLVEHQWPPRSTRQMVEYTKRRIYSSDWKLPDEIFFEATRRLEQWLNQECADPAAPVSTDGLFKADLVSWPN